MTSTIPTTGRFEDTRWLWIPVCTAPAYYSCKHCPAWAECDYIWDLEEEAENG